MIKRIVTCYFSPTGGTKRIAKFFSSKIGQAAEAKYYPVFSKNGGDHSVNSEDVSNNLGGKGISLGGATGISREYIDFTSRKNREKIYRLSQNDLLIIASPVYAGRIPNKIEPDFRKCFVGHGAKAIAICSFGNRSYGGALTELRLMMQNNGFDVAGAAAVVSPHPFSELIGAGRPDADDFQSLSAFAGKVLGNIDAGIFVNLPEDTRIPPYYTPLKLDGTPAKFLKAKPVTRIDKCDNCGRCAAVCPVVSIDSTDCAKVNGICIKCQACVKACPHGAKYFDDPDFLSHVEMLEKNYTKPHENYFVV